MSDPTAPDPASPSAGTRAVPSWVWLLTGLVIGIVGLLVVRFVTFHHDETHYHANFAVFINGERETFKDPQYYQEVKICSLGGTSPQSRTHMHNSENGSIHIHDKAVTWGQFFENLGWMIGPDFVRTTTQLLTTDDSNTLNVILNGQDLTDVSTITNQVIGDTDRLLVSYGSSDKSGVDSQYKTVPNTAAQYNAENDPASCGASDKPTTKERLRNLL